MWRGAVHPRNASGRAATFTLASVTGRIRKMEVECERGGGRLEFRDASEWTLPAKWGACTLTVTAKRETTFAFVEFN